MANPVSINERLGRMHTLERMGFPRPLSCAVYRRRDREQGSRRTALSIFARQARDWYLGAKLKDPDRMPHVKAHRRPRRPFVSIDPVTMARRAGHFASAAAATGNPAHFAAMRAVFFLGDHDRHDRNPRTELAGLQHALDNFTGYCGEDDAIGDKIAYLTRFEYVFRPDLYGTEYTPRAW